MLRSLRSFYPKIRVAVFVVAFLQVCSFSAFADSVIWNFTALTSAAASSSNANVPAAGCTASIGNVFGSISTPINTTSASSGYTGATGGGNIGNAVNVTGNTTFNSGTSPYISFIITPNPGYYVTITGLSFGSRSTGTGPQAYTISTSVAGFGTGIASGAIPNNSVWNLYTPSFSSVVGASGTAIEVRIFGYGGSGSPFAGTENWRIDDVNFTILVASATAPPSFVTNPSPLSLCTGTSGNFSTLVAGGSTYQWQRSNGGPYTNITSSAMDAGITYAGFTTQTLTVTPSTTAANGYNYQLVATNTFGSTTSSAAALSVTATPVVAAITGGAASICTAGPSGTTTFSDATAAGVWSSTNTAAATIAGSGTTGTVTGIATGTTTISYAVTNGSCVSAATTTVNVTSTPTTPSVTPAPFAVCQNQPTTLLSATGGTVTTPVTASSASGTVNLPVSAPNAVATSSVFVSGIPGTATVTGISATIDFSSNFVNDYVFNLVAPNGQIYNLIYQEGPHGAGSYTGTVISSAGTTALNTGSTPFTGTYAGDGFLAVGPAGYLSTALSWSSLYAVPNGNWTLVAYNNSTFTNSPTTLTDWTMKVNYTYPQQMPMTWSPTPNLFTNSGGTTSYTGTNTLTVYEKPNIPGVITYTATATNGSCTSFGTTTVTVNPLPLPISGVSAICNGASTTLSDPTPGGSWSSSNTSIAAIFPGTGLLVGTGAGIATLSYTLPTTCYMTFTETINPLPAVYNITGGGSYCSGGTGVHIGLNGSTVGVSYQLYNGSTPTGVPVVGTGSAIDFGLQTAVGTYKAEATNQTTFCENAMSGTVNVSTTPLPNLHTVTGGGSYCSGGTGVHIGLNGSETGFSYQLYNGGSTSGGSVSGTGSALDFGLKTAAGTYTVVATNNTTACTATMTGSATVNVNPLPTTYSVTGGGSYCSGGTGEDVGLGGSQTGVNYQLYVGGSPIGSSMAGTGSSLDFGLQTTGGSYTVWATNATTACNTGMTGSVSVTVLPLPNVYNVSTGGSYCAGGTGVDVTLSNSDIGFSYQLFLGGVATGSPMAGTGTSLDFGMQTTAGTYTIQATNVLTLCTSWMTGSAVVNVLPLPTRYSVTGGGGYCAGGTGVHVGLGNSQLDINYQLYNGSSTVGSAMPGTGSPLDFGLQLTPGTYWVLATNSTTSCNDTMTGSAMVAINPLPTVYSVTGGGSYCAGGTGVAVGLSNSDAGINYVLYRGLVGGSLTSGTGSSISFGLQTTAGTYIVVATNATSLCTDTMSGNAMISINPLPNVHDVMGTGSYCAGGTGVDIWLDGSDIGFSYQLWYGGSPTGSPKPGTDTAIDFGMHTGGGAYTVVATNTATLCTNMMDGSAVVTILPIVHPSVGIIRSTPDSICAGSIAIFTAIPSYGGSSPSYQWMVNDVAVGTDSVAYAFSPADSNRISVRMASNHSCAVPDTVLDSTSIRVFPNEIPTVHITANPGDVVCRGTSVTYLATPTYGGTSPVYAWIKDGAMVSTSPTYTYIPSDSDDVYCLMYSHYLCRIHDSAFSDAIYMRVENPSVPAVTITGRPGTIVGIGKPDTLMATVTNAGPGVTYQWYVNMLPIPAATTATFIYSSYHNNDSVSCMVTREDACSLSSINSVVITVKNVGVTSITSASNISLVPNPNRGVFTLKGSLATTEDAEVTIEITNMLGQSVYKGRTIAKGGVVDQEVQLDNTANGIYLLNLNTQTGKDVFRFVIEK